MEGQNPGRGGRGNYVAAVYPGRGGRGGGGAMAAQNPGRGGRGAVWYPGRGGRGNGGAIAVQNIGRGGRGIVGAAVAFNPIGGRGIGGDLAAAEVPEFLPPNEALGGYIFMCNHNTLPEITELMVFGYPETLRHRVEAITPGLPLFLYNLSTRCLHGIYEAADIGGFNIEPRFCTRMNDPGRSFFPAQVRVRWRTEYQPLNRQISSGIMENLRTPWNNYYRYRVELTAPEAENISDAFAANGVAPE